MLSRLLLALGGLATLALATPPAPVPLGSAATSLEVAGQESAEQAAAARPGMGRGSYHALVIGNDDYRDLSDLSTAVRDARAVSELLAEDYGFQVRTLVDTTRQQMVESLWEYAESLGEEDSLLVYFAGHGKRDERTQRGYWLGVDAGSTPARWLSNETLRDILKACRARHVLVVSDSCFSGSLTRSGEEADLRGLQVTPGDSRTEREAKLAERSRRRSRMVLTSGGDEPVSDEGFEGHSVFAHAFLMSLRRNTGVLDGYSLYPELRRYVELNSRVGQVPQYVPVRECGHDFGDFLFVRTDAASSTGLFVRTDAASDTGATLPLAPLHDRKAYSRLDGPAVLALATRAKEHWSERLAAFRLLRVERFAAGGASHHVAIWLHEATGLEFVLVPGGTFTMGSPVTEPGRDEGEREHEVTLAPFLIARTECTGDAWARELSRIAPGSAPAYHAGSLHPITNMDWEEVDRWCRGAGLDLPTEAQWEYACRAGTRTAYAFGHGLLGEQANVGPDAKEAVEVGRYPANAFGLLDMHGNVSELCRDSYEDYRISVARGSGLRGSSAEYHVHRGGHFRWTATDARSASRNPARSNFGYPSLGFRPALDLP